MLKTKRNPEPKISERTSIAFFKASGLAERLDSGIDSLRELVRKYQDTGDEDIRLKAAMSLTDKVFGMSHDEEHGIQEHLRDDAVSAGLFAIWEALPKTDPDKAVWNYLKEPVKWAFIKTRAADRLVKLRDAQTMQRLYEKIEKAEEEKGAPLDREELEPILKKHAMTCYDYLMEKNNRNPKHKSLNAPAGNDNLDDVTLGELLPDENPDPEELLLEGEPKHIVSHAMEKALTPRERTVVQLHAFQELSFGEISRRRYVPLTREMVRLVYNGAIKKLEREITNDTGKIGERKMPPPNTQPRFSSAAP